MMHVLQLAATSRCKVNTACGIMQGACWFKLVQTEKMDAGAAGDSCHIKKVTRQQVYGMLTGSVIVDSV